MASGKIPGSNALTPAVPFAEPSSGLSGISPTTANTNYGKSVSTKDRSMPVSNPPEMGEEPQTTDFGEGTWKGEWGKNRKGGA